MDREPERWTQQLVEIGIALSAERDHDRLLERILLEAMQIAGADGGTLYIYDTTLDALRFAIMRTESLELALGGTTGAPIPYPPVPLHIEGRANHNNVAAYVALESEVVCIEDVYSEDDAFDFSGTRAYDARTGYSSRSMLAVPLIGSQGELTGVLQLLNAQDEAGRAVPFGERVVQLARAMASQAAVAIENQRLLGAQRSLAEAYRRIVEIGIALSAERDHDRLLERILLEAMQIAGADGGTLYIYDDEADALRFEIMRNSSLDIALGGTTGKPVPYPPVPLHTERGPNHGNVAAHVALASEVVCIEDVYSEDDAFDFSGTRAYDARTGYHSRSMLAVPLVGSQGGLTGVLQLLNARDAEGRAVAFSAGQQLAVKAMAGAAAVAIDNHNLVEAQKRLLESFIRTIARAIDLKSPYTGGHCQRVPILTELIAQAACDATSGPFADFQLDADEMYELSIAAWLHDCGKVTTPDYVVDKATKLETIHDRIQDVRTRFLLIERELELESLRAAMKPGADRASLEAGLDRERVALREALSFVERSNIGGEFMSDGQIAELHAIAERWTWRDHDGTAHPALSPDELRNLSIRRGTLNDDERDVIQNHIVATIEMLEQLPFPRHLRRVPEYAGAHHEKMDGTGYPRGLTGEQMTLPARMMAIADVFEALTAGDRPYKKAKPLSEAIRILSFMRNDGHIDPQLFDLFLESNIWRDYAERFLEPEQLDEVDISRYLNRT